MLNVVYHSPQHGLFVGYITTHTSQVQAARWELTRRPATRIYTTCQKNVPFFARLISESETMKTADKSRYFVGLTTPVLFVAFLSLLAFIGIVFGASIIAGLHAFFFLVLPLASTGVGAYLIAAPETTMFGSDPTVTLLLRAAGALSIAYAGGALLVGMSSCAKIRTMHLVVTAAVTGTVAVVFASDEGSVVAAEVSTKAAGILGLMSLAATASAAMTAYGPTLIKKIESGKPSEPILCFE